MGAGLTNSTGASVTDVAVKARSRLRLLVILAIAAFGAVMILPALVVALMVPFHGGVVIHLALVGVMILGFVAVASSGMSRLAAARNAVVRLPAIRDPVQAAAARRGLAHLGIMTPGRLVLLSAATGDVHTALGLGGNDDRGASIEMPDEWRGAFPDGSPFWCVLKKSTIPLAGVPEHYRQAGEPAADATAGMLTMLVAFPLRRRTALKLEILHRFMQVRFARIARTLDTGSSEFNMRFFVSARHTEDLVPVFRIVTPALQTVLIDLFERFWLVNLIVNDTTAFLSAVAFNPQGVTPQESDDWISASLDDCIAGAARVRTYLD